MGDDFDTLFAQSEIGAGLFRVPLCIEKGTVGATGKILCDGTLQFAEPVGMAAINHDETFTAVYYHYITVWTFDEKHLVGQALRL